MRLSVAPAAFLARNFLSDQECSKLIELVSFRQLIRTIKVHLPHVQ